MPFYFDYAAASPPSKQALTDFSKLQQELFYNPSALHDGAKQASEALESARRQVAASLQTKQQEINFTSGATEANNIAIQGFSKLHPDLKALTLEHEHSALTGPVLASEGFLIAPSPKSVPNQPLEFKDIKDEVGLIALSFVASGTGVIYDTHKLKLMIAEVLKNRQARGVSNPLYLLLDFSQGVQTLKVQPQSHGADLATYNGAKIGALSGTGCLYVDSKIQLKSIYKGGGQQRGLRPGTESTAAWVVFAQTLSEVVGQMSANNKKLSSLQHYLETGLDKIGAEIVAKNISRSPHITRAIFKGEDNEILAYKLNQEGIYVGIGSACHAEQEPAGKDLLALGYSKQQSLSSLRFSISTQTTKAEIDQLIKALAKIT